MNNENEMSDFYCEEANYKFLDDNVDFLPYIEKYKGKKFIDMIIEIETEWADKDIVQNHPALEGILFNWIGEEELANYLRNRYPKEFDYIEITTRYIL
jgi:hypothetical protein